jgi:hypothetical protein
VSESGSRIAAAVLVGFPEEEGAQAGGVVDCSGGSQTATERGASEFPSCLEESEQYLADVAGAAEEVVVGTCECCYLSAGHDLCTKPHWEHVLCPRSQAVFEIGLAREWCKGRTGLQECGHCLECGGVRGLYGSQSQICTRMVDVRPCRG